VIKLDKEELQRRGDEAFRMIMEGGSSRKKAKLRLKKPSSTPQKMGTLSGGKVPLEEQEKFKLMCEKVGVTEEEGFKLAMEAWNYAIKSNE
jgi:hypothetical protein